MDHKYLYWYNLPKRTLIQGENNGDSNLSRRT